MVFDMKYCISNMTFIKTVFSNGSIFKKDICCYCTFNKSLFLFFKFAFSFPHCLNKSLTSINPDGSNSVLLVLGPYVGKYLQKVFASIGCMLEYCSLGQVYKAQCNNILYMISSFGLRHLAYQYFQFEIIQQFSMANSKTFYLRN